MIKRTWHFNNRSPFALMPWNTQRQTNLPRMLPIFLVTALLLSACSIPLQTPSDVGLETEDISTIPSTVTVSPFVSVVPTSTFPPTSTRTPTLQPSDTPTATASPTPDPYAGLSIDALTARGYGGGDLQIEEVLAVNSYFTRTLITYPSDGLTIYGFMNVPKRGNPPFPVVIANHGYIDPDIYDTLDYTTRYADALARSGFLVLHPNLRGYPPSDAGDNLFRVGMAIDVLNLIALVKEHGGQPGPLEQANPQAIGLWGHSMGGGITTRVITISPDVRAAVLYAAMSGDEKQNFEAINRWSDGLRGLEELDVPEFELSRISPIYYLDRIQAPVSIHHGRSDELVPLNWSLDLCNRLQELGKTVECFTYKNQPHTFYSDGDALFVQRTIEFFDQQLRSP